MDFFLKGFLPEALMCESKPHDLFGGHL